MGSIAKIKTVADMTKILESRGKPLESFKAGQIIKASNKMVKKYSYKLEANPGTNFAPDFKPYATPGEMLAMGVFEGKYLNDCLLEFPAEWYWNAILAGKLKPEGADVSVNLFGVDSRQPLKFWTDSGWLPGGTKKGQHPELSDSKINPDERGWFQWYCRYYMGRRITDEDIRQIRRWKMMTRHIAQIRKNCKGGDISCRPVQRQALLHWAYDTRRL